MAIGRICSGTVPRYSGMGLPRMGGVVFSGLSRILQEAGKVSQNGLRAAKLGQNYSSAAVQ